MTGEIVGDPHAHTELDYALEYAIQVIEDFTDQYGLLAWEVDDEAVEVKAIKKIHPFKESMELVTKGTPKKPYQPTAGEYFVPEVRTLRTNGHIQTFTEWAHQPPESS